MTDRAQKGSKSYCSGCGEFFQDYNEQDAAYHEQCAGRPDVLDEYGRGGSKAMPVNPKDLLGVKKVPLLSVVPAAGLIYEALAMRYGAYEAPKKDGTKGYGPYNWRGNAVVASIYIDAAIRHLMAWYDGEELAADSKVPHLGHAKACIGILADAIETDNLKDDRPPAGNAAALLDEWRLTDDYVPGDAPRRRRDDNQNPAGGY